MSDRLVSQSRYSVRGESSAKVKRSVRPPAWAALTTVLSASGAVSSTTGRSTKRYALEPVL